jgi:Ca2+-transporting ATPase
MDHLPPRGSGGGGLTEQEAERRRERFGPNRVLPDEDRGWTRPFRDTLRDPMLWFLLGSSGLYLLIDELAEALVLLLAVLPLFAMDAFLHRRTIASTRGLAQRLATRARVLRGEAVRTVRADELVPGDLVLVEADQWFPADGLLEAGTDVQVDESSLSGESWPVRKEPLEAGIPLETSTIDAANWVLAGTRLLTGSARVRLIHTGAGTLYGEIARSAQLGDSARTPLQTSVARLVSRLLAAAVAFCGMLAAVRLLQGHGPIDALLSAVTLAVAALPEEFPIALTFYLGVGVYRLARRRALVRRGVAVENIGRVTTICTDKTGTITEGRLTVARLEPAAGTEAEALLRVAAGAARAESGDPMDAAILEHARSRRLGVLPDRVAVFPFTEARKRETAILGDPDGSRRAVTKGAPELVLGLCEGGGQAAESGLAAAERLSAGGYKVIGCAVLELPASAPDGLEPTGPWRFAGLVAFEDPIREGVTEAVCACRRAGVRVLMITGDHPATAEAVARRIGLGGEQPRLRLADALDPEAEGLQGRLQGVDVVARAVPSQKLAIVRALRAQGEIVAVTGDGVNDVPALQAADVGIAMGERGTESARDLASIVLLDDNFRTIVGAIAEGRRLFASLRHSFAYLLMMHVPLVLTASLIPLAGQPLLYLPMHVVWLELIMHPTALLVFQEPPGAGEEMPPSTARRTGFFEPREWFAILGVGALLALLLAAGYSRSVTTSLEHGRAMALALLTLSSASLVAVLAPLRQRGPRVAIGTTFATTVAMVQIPWIATPMHLAPLHAGDWLAVFAGAFLVLAVAKALWGWRGSAADRPH